MLTPIARMLERYQAEKEDSDVSAFYGLMFLGELVTKIIVCTLVSGITDDRDRSRFSLLRELVRADGIGDWATYMDAALVGPSSQYLRSDFKGLQRELLTRVGRDEWQHEAIFKLSRR